MFKRISVISMLLLVIVLASCASIFPVSNKTLFEAAMAEMRMARNGLGMYQAEHDSSHYPETEMIRSYRMLVEVLSPYVRLPSATEASWQYGVYFSTRPDSFVLMGNAFDKEYTEIRATPTRVYIYVYK